MLACGKVRVWELRWSQMCVADVSSGVFFMEQRQPINSATPLISYGVVGQTPSAQQSLSQQHTCCCYLRFGLLGATVTVLITTFP